MGQLRRTDAAPLPPSATVLKALLTPNSEEQAKMQEVPVPG